ncbi:MAG TPA: FadR/GntR family transcriptional regulator [Desulfosarcina sp.]|nr:FadR/GntR family transcriptional regulator [Desulfosarcina sp.]
MDENPKKDKAPALIVREVLARIKTGELKPGDRLPPQREMADHYGFGRSSVREAINALIGMGYIEAIQGSGTFISRRIPQQEPSALVLDSFLEAASIFDLMEGRELLECRAAELAAERVEESQLLAIGQAVQKIKANIGDISGFFQADLEFHLALAEASGNRVIAELIRLLIQRVHKHHIQFRATSSPEVREHTYQTAQEVLNHIAGGDGSRAARCMRNHLRRVNSKLREVISEIAPMISGIPKSAR